MHSILKKLYSLFRTPSGSALFEEELSREIIKSERLRVAVLAAFSLFIGTWAGVEFLFPTEARIKALEGAGPGIPAPLFMAASFLFLALYELAVFFIAGRNLERNAQPPAFPRYLTAFIEVSIPSVLLYSIAGTEGPQDALSSPTIFLYFIFIIISALRLDFGLCLFTGGVACCGYVLVSTIVISGGAAGEAAGPIFNADWHMERGLIFLGSGFVTGLVTLQIRRRVVNSIRRINEMTESFSRFVPKEFLHFLDRENIVRVKLGDQVMREMTVLFSDIRSFTALSERMTPQENIDFLNAYLMRMGPIIRKNNGFIDKYIGDAIMALFPGPVDEAVEAALGMQREVAEFNRARGSGGWAPVAIGVGIHTGMLMLGTIGEANRLDTTVIADAVNIASRLEGLNKRFNSGILVSRISFDLLKEPKSFPFRRLGSVEIRGRRGELEVVEIVVP